MSNGLTLKSLLVPGKDNTVEYPGMPGFLVDVCFISRETLLNIRKKATKTTFKNRQSVDEVNDDLFMDLYVKACVKGWKGLKLSYLEQLAPIELGSNAPDDELAYSEDNALFLMKSSAQFDAFISEQISDLGNFTKTK